MSAARARDAALRLLAVRERTCRELTDRLAQRGFDRDVVDRVVAELASSKLVDDARFAAELVRSELRRAPAGSALLEAKLRRKGVAPDVARAATTAGLESRDARRDALEVARKHARSARPDAAPAVVERRVAAKLARRGFDPELARDVARVVADEHARGAASE